MKVSRFNVANLIAGLAFVWMFAAVQVAFAAGTVANLRWVHPTANIDNSPLAVADILETVIEYRRPGAALTSPAIGVIRVAAPAVTASVPGLACGDYSFVAFTVARAQPGTRSDPSTPPTSYATEIVCRPNPPTGLTAD